MKFWDSSAVVPVLLNQPRTAHCRQLLQDDPEIVVWWGTTSECGSAIARLHRDGHLEAAGERDARALLDALRASWYEVQPGDVVREHALRLIRLHPLRAADALQLAAALEWAGTPATGAFVTFDERLQDAARREGFETP